MGSLSLAGLSVEQPVLVVVSPLVVNNPVAIGRLGV